MRCDRPDASALRAVRTVLLFAATLSPLACAPASASVVTQSPQIGQAEVERIVSALAADSMRGREAFSEDARRAADFLAAEFAAAGLESVEGAEGYLQRFSARTLTARDATVRVGGRTLFPNQIAFRPGTESISWSNGDVPVIVVGPEDEPLTTIMSVANGGFPALVLVNEMHNEVFRQIVQIFRRSVRVLSDAVGTDLVVALVNAEEDVAFEVSAVATVVEEPLANVVGMVPGRRSEEFVIFSAHYDHLGVVRPFRGDSISNGANDDASGTAAVVTLAKYFADRPAPERTLLFVAFTAEEGGMYGSRYFSRQIDPENVVAMFNIEMIGKPSAEGPGSAWITGFDESSFGSILDEAARGSGFRFVPDPYPRYDLFHRSDNTTLAELGVPAHSISTTPIDVDPDYHKVTDEIGTLDFAHLTQTIRAIALGAEPIVSGRATPTRVREPSGNP